MFETLFLLKTVPADLLYLVKTSGDESILNTYQAIDSRFNDYNAAAIHGILTLWKENGALSDHMVIYGEKISAQSQSLQVEAQKKVDRYKSEAIRFSMALLLVGVVLGALLTWFIIRSITMPLRQTGLVLKDIARGKGDLTSRIQVKSNDEIGELAHWFNQFIDNLRSMILDISGNADTLGGSSKALAGISKNMSDRIGDISLKSGSVSRSTRDMNEAMASVTGEMEQTTMSGVAS